MNFPLFNEVSPIEMIIYFTMEPWPRDQQAENYNIQYKQYKAQHNYTYR